MSNRQQERIMLDRTEIQYVTEYLYLRQLVSFEHEMDKEMKSHTSMASLLVNEVHPPRQINQSQSQTNNTQHLYPPSFIVWLPN